MDASFVNDQNRKRFAFLHRLYEVTHGDRYQIVNLFELGQEVGLSHEESGLAFDYLEGEGLMKSTTLGGGISISHEGVVQVESALQQPDEPSHFFPPVNVIFAASITNSQIQQGTIWSSQAAGISGDDLRALQEFVHRMRTDVPNLGAPPDLEAEIHSELSTLEAQAASPKPKQPIIAEALHSLRNILEGMAGSALAAALLELLRQLQH